MNDPYELLGLTSDADETSIRQRYLELVRQFPPDREPERFVAIRAAFDELKDPARRLETLILRPCHADTLDAMAADLRARLSKARLPLDSLLALADRS